MQDIQTISPAARCFVCWGELYPGEPLLDWEGRPLHPDCLERFLARRFPLFLAEEEEVCDYCGQSILPAEEMRRPFSLTLHDDCLPLWGALQFAKSKGGYING